MSTNPKHTPGPFVFKFNGNTFAVHFGAIYFWHGTHVSNIPYAAKRKNGIEAYAKSMGQRELTIEEREAFAEAFTKASDGAE